MVSMWIRRQSALIAAALPACVLCACAVQPRPADTAEAAPAGYTFQPFGSASTRPARTDRIVARNDPFII
jgi:hypothetical protein